MAIIDLRKELNSNSIVLVSDVQDVVLRRVVNRKGQLVAERGNGDDNFINIDENDKCYCIGKVISVLRSV